MKEKIVGITINGLIRDHISQLIKVYEFVTGLEPIYPINPYKLEESFPNVISEEEKFQEFDVTKEDVELEPQINEQISFDLIKEMYENSAFEVFGRAEEVYRGLLLRLKALEKTYNIKFVLLSKESPRSKAATLFFLSKINFDFEKVIFPHFYIDFWNEVDIMITDNPNIIKNKPKNKGLISIVNEHNCHIRNGQKIKSINDFRSLKRALRKILKQNNKVNG